MSTSPPAGPVPPIPSPAQLVEINYLIDVSTWTFAIFFAVLVWDCIISFPVEYKVIWKRKLSLASILYLGARYWSIFAMMFATIMFTSVHIPEDWCKSHFRWIVGLLLPIEAFSGAILAVRTHALLGSKLWVAIALFAALGSVVGYMVSIVAKHILLQFIPNAAGTGGTCLTVDDEESLGYWLGPLLFNTLVTAAQFVQVYRLKRDGLGMSGLLGNFVRNGLIYFFLTFAGSAITLGFTLAPNQFLHGVTIALQLAISSLMSCRLVLTLRAADPRDDTVSGLSASTFERVRATTKYQVSTGRTPVHELTTISARQNSKPIPIHVDQSVMTYQDEEKVDIESGNGRSYNDF